MDKWYKIIDGKQVWFREPLEVDGVQYWNNLTDEMMEKGGWAKYVEPAPTPQQLIDRAKSSKMEDIDMYNDSPAVNVYYINGTAQDWLTPAQRVNYRQTIEAAKRKGMSVIPFAGLSLPVDFVLAAIDDIDIYAWQQTACCERCKAAVNALTKIEDVDAYDYKSEFSKTECPKFVVTI